MKKWLFYLYKRLNCFINPLCLKISLRYRVYDIFIAGTNYTLISDKYVIKIPNPNRLKELKKEFDICGIWSIGTKYQELKMFKQSTSKTGFIDKQGVLFLEKIDAKPLSFFLSDKDIFLSLFTQVITQLLILNQKNGFIHADLHIDNILIQNDTLYFIDFDFRYNSTFQINGVERDILHLLFIMKKEYLEFFIRYSPELKSIVESSFDVSILMLCMDEMKCFFQIGYKELW